VKGPFMNGRSRKNAPGMQRAVSLSYKNTSAKWRHNVPPSG